MSLNQAEEMVDRQWDGVTPTPNRDWASSELRRRRMELKLSEVQRQRVSSELEIQKAFFQQLFASSPEGIVLLDNKDRVVDANRAFERLFQYRLAEIKSRSLNELIVPSDLLEEATELSSRALSNVPVDTETVRRRKDGELVEVSVLGCPIVLDSERLGVYGIYRDVTVRRNHERHLEYLARFDALTGLPNRALFEDRMNQALIQSRRTGERIAVHYLDLDNFKTINDTLGHRIGDELLAAVASRLEQTVREADTVARLGGDEFAIVQTGVRAASGATALARKVVESFAPPFDVSGHRIHTGATIGISLSTSGIEAETLMSQADTALHKGKAEGRNRVKFHNRAMAQEMRSYMTLHRELHGALERDEFRLEYQPQVDLSSGSIVGCEALVRWQHPDRGLLQPGSFIHVTEKSGLIVSLGEWVLREACRQRREWSAAGVPDYPVAVNVAAAQFKDPAFVGKVVGALEETGLAPELLHLELTESTLLERGDRLDHALQELHDHGIRFCIDDFGTGYSSLQYLRAFPFHKVKIAREFVDGVLDGRDDAAIVDAVASLGRKLGLVVLAEGVEDGRQLGFLRGCGCSEVQGFFFSRPVPPKVFVELQGAWSGYGSLEGDRRSSLGG